jgi:hypothetical protein
MQLTAIDKSRYRKHLNLVFTGIVIALVVITLAASTLYIRYFSTPEAPHFFHNLAGVITAVVIVVSLLTRLRSHPFMREVVYVWDLKQQLNRIYRKQRKLEAAVEHGDREAMIILNFQYRGSKQLYELDDNTITIDALMSKIRMLDKRMQDAGLSVSTDAFEPAMLDKF